MSISDLDYVDKIVEQFGTAEDRVIPILQALQSHYRYLPESALKRVCQITHITPAAMMGVSSFYTQFRHKPVGKHIICVCHGTACHVKGAQAVQNALYECLGIPYNDDTDKDGIFTVEKVSCLGCCTLAPVVQIDSLTYGHLSPGNITEMLSDFHVQKNHDKNDVSSQDNLSSLTSVNLKGEIHLGMGSCCQAQGSMRVHDEILQVIQDYHLPIRIKRVGCVGMCHQTPLLEIAPSSGEKKIYTHVKPLDVKRILTGNFPPSALWDRLTLRAERFLDSIFTGELSHHLNGQIQTKKNAAHPILATRDTQICQFLGPQRHLATEHGGSLDPVDINEYMHHDGFLGLKNALKMHSHEIIQVILNSGLRGRGGAGFSTGKKWKAVADAPGSVKYIICNGDEGDPGAFMDRMILESFPFRVLEGMCIAARAVGATLGFLYIRAEYPLAVKRMRAAIQEAEKLGFTGNLHLEIKEGAGAFVCGEETALIESIEGHRGMPRLRPPFPALSGLYGKPTLINNVETYAMVPWILRHGADAFSCLGTETSRGTKVFALAGNVKRGGLIEVPMGITLRQIVEEIGGGVPDGRKLKAVQVGGPSGGCVPEALMDTPVDYEALNKVGAIMGSGGLVVLDDRDCMVDIARFFLQFTQDQSCGKCTFCRVGTRRMLDILNQICEGKASIEQLSELEKIAYSVKYGSLCGLGKTAPNPVISTLKYFRDEYHAHLNGKCPAGKCSALVRYEILNRCTGCTLCAQACPTGAIIPSPYQRHYINMQKCSHCDACRKTCPHHAVVIR